VNFEFTDNEIEINHEVSVRSNSEPTVVDNQLNDTTIGKRAKALQYMDLANVVYVAISSLGAVALVNRKACDILGYSENEIIGKNWSENFVPERFKDQVIPLSHNPLTNETELAKHTEFPLLTRDGEERIMLWHHKVIDDDDGKTIGYLSSGEDVTDLRKSEEATRKSEMEYRFLFENMPNGFAFHKIVTDNNNKPIDYIFLEINEAFKHHTGLTRDIIGMKVTDVFKGITNHEPDLISIYGKVALSKEPIKFEMYFEPMERWFSISAYCPRKGFFICLLENITEKRLLEEQRIESEELYRGIFENHLAGNYISKPNGDIITCNPAFLRMFGYSSIEEMKTQSLISLYSSREERDEFICLLKEKKKLEFLEKKLIHKNGKKLNVIENSIAVFDGHNEMVEIHGYLIDISTRKNLEEQLHHSLKMEGIGRLAGGVAHDFNNLLTIITGYSEIALMSLSDDHPARDEILEIKSAALRASELTGQLLAISRKQTLQPKVIDLNQVIKKLDGMLLRIIDENIQFEIIPSNSIGNVFADPGQIEQVFINLVINARDAMPMGGKLTIELSEVTFDEEYVRNYPDVSTGNYIMAAVSDTGCGMTEEIKAQVFDPFFTTKDERKGTGLGLSTIYGIIKQSDGFIRVWSEIGEGSIFYIYLPSSSIETVPDTQVHGSSVAPVGTENIVLVEDQAGVRNMASRNLRKLGYTVFEANSGTEALDMCKGLKVKIHLIITDVIMPKMSGPELINELHKDMMPDVKALFMSGHPPETISQHGVMDSDIPCLLKPFENISLARKIREVLDN